MRIPSETLRYLRIFRRHLGLRLYVVFLLTMLAVLIEAFGIALLLPLLELIGSGAGEGAAHSSTQAVPEPGAAHPSTQAVPEPGAAHPSTQAPSPIETPGPSTHSLSLTLQLGRLLHTLGIGHSLPGILLFIGAIFLLKGGVRFAEGTYKATLSANLLREIKGRLFSQYSTMDYRWYTAHNTGHFVNLISVQVNRLLHTFEAFKRFVSEIIIASVYLGFAFLVSWTFALMAALSGLVLMLAFRRLNRYAKRLSDQTSSEYSTLHAQLVQAMHAFPYLAATGQTNSSGSRVMRSIFRLTGYYRNQLIALSLTRSLREPVAVALILGLVIVQLTLFQAPLAPILVSLLLTYRAMTHLMGIQGAWQQTMNLSGGLDMVERELAELARHQEPRGTLAAKPFAGQIRLEGVTLTYPGRTTPAVRDVSMHIPSGSTTALFGPSGAGKSTILSLITLLMRPDSGTLTIDGLPGEQIDPLTWRRQIGYVPQEPVFFDDTIAHNIALVDAPGMGGGVARVDGAGVSTADVARVDGAGVSTGGRARVDGAGVSTGDVARVDGAGVSTGDEARVDGARLREAARRAGALGFIEALPDGFQTHIGDRGIRLSGGQKQRLAIARELYKNPAILILDEATSALDRAMEQEVQQSIKNLKGQLTLILISHRVQTIRDADRIYLLEQGSIAASGSYEQLAERIQP